MLILALIGISLLIAICLFLFGRLWYSPLAFGKILAKNKVETGCSMKVAIPLEFLSCLLISIAAVVVFAPFDWYFGLVNGLIISVAIILPFTISDAIWHQKISFSRFFIQLGHKISLILISFVLAGILNNLIIPMIMQSYGNIN
jgi:hypothetical protein